MSRSRVSCPKWLSEKPCLGVSGGKIPPPAALRLSAPFDKGDSEGAAKRGISERDEAVGLAVVQIGSEPIKAALQRHPATPACLVRSIEARIGWDSAGALALTFALEGDLTQLRIPAPQPSRRAGNLWRHTCFEAFVRHKGEPAYYEFNFAPSGEWAVYAFRRYRDGMLLAPDFDPCIVVRRTEDRLELAALIRPDCLPLVQPRKRVKLAFSAVVEDEQGAVSYWALTHPPGRPDFHHPDAFTLELEWPDAD